MLGDRGYYAGGISLKAFNSLKLSKDELMNERPLIIPRFITRKQNALRGIPNRYCLFQIYRTTCYRRTLRFDFLQLFMVCTLYTALILDTQNPEISGFSTARP